MTKLTFVVDKFCLFTVKSTGSLDASTFYCCKLTETVELKRYCYCLFKQKNDWKEIENKWYFLTVTYLFI